MRVLADGPLMPALERIARAFEGESGQTVHLVTATSPELMRRLRQGEVAYVIAIQRDLLEALTAEGRILTTSRIRLGQIGIGLAVRAATVQAPVTSVPQLRAALLAADLVVFNTVASGGHFAQVIAQLGLTESLQSRVARTNPAGVFRRILEGSGRDIGVGTVSLILATPGLALLGPLPAELQSSLQYDAATLADAPQTALAATFLRRLVQPSGRAAFEASGGVPASE